MLIGCEKWVKAKGCREFADACEIGSRNSYNFYKALKRIETNQIR